jgi:uncharacterized protein DUF4034
MHRLLPALTWLTLAACSGWRDSAGSRRDLDPESGPPAELVVRNETRERKDFGRQMRDLLNAGQYDSLDRIAHTLRQQQVRWPNGYWKLRSFYVYGFDGPAHEESETEWKAYLSNLRTWVATRPNSVTARVALGNSLVGYAWHARSDGWAQDVSDAGWRLFKIRLSEADSVLRTSQRVPERCPGMPAALQRVALGQNWDSNRYDSLFNAAIEAEPGYDSYYELKAHSLLPRWGGRRGEWERFAEEAADHLGGPAGDVVYARIVWSLEEYYDNMFKETRASWDRTSRGYQELLRIYPHSLELQSQYAKLATQAESRGEVRLMFDRMGPRVDPAVWRTRDYFVAVRDWATQ